MTVTVWCRLDYEIFKSTSLNFHAQPCPSPSCSSLFFWSCLDEMKLILFIKYVLFYLDSHDCIIYLKKMKTFTIVNKQNDCLKVFSNLLISSAHLMPSCYKSSLLGQELNHFKRIIYDIFITIECWQISSHSFEIIFKRHQVQAWSLLA